MSASDRSVLLTTACDDLQAQLEASDRSFRHIDHDLTALRETLRATVVHSDTLARLQQHLADLRGNMREQRSALREVRSAATKLCATVVQARNEMATLAEDKHALESTHAALLNEHARQMCRAAVGHDADAAEQGHQPPSERVFTRLPADAASDREPKA
jgi:chromosome segregation ATPase